MSEEKMYMVEVTETERVTLLAGLGALIKASGAIASESDLRMIVETGRVLLNGEEFDPEEDDLDLVELNERERSILATALGTAAAMADRGVLPRTQLFNAQTPELRELAGRIVGREQE